MWNRNEADIDRDCDDEDGYSTTKMRALIDTAGVYRDGKEHLDNGRRRVASAAGRVPLLGLLWSWPRDLRCGTGRLPRPPSFIV